MANFSGYQDFLIDRMGSLIDWDDPTLLPLCMSPYLRNTRYTAEGAGTRYGSQTTMQVDSHRVTGLACLNYHGDSDITYPLVFNNQGVLSKEYPEGSGTMIPVVPSTGASLPVRSYMEATIAFGRLYAVFHDNDAKYGNWVLDGKSGLLDPISMRPLGDTWVKNWEYQIPEVVTPTVPNGHLYRCTVAGTGGATEPVTWPLSTGTTFADGGATLQEFTPNFNSLLPIYPTAAALTRVPSGGTFAAGKDVYFILTYLNTDGGETAVVSPAPFAGLSNTNLNDSITIAAPGVLPAYSWLSGLGATVKPTLYNVYYAQVAHSAGAPDASTYVLWNAAPIALASPSSVTDFSNNFGASPLLNTFTIAGFGNICAGVRDAVVLFKNRNGYYDGASENTIIEVDIASSGYRIFMGNIPTGPPGTMARAVAFTLAAGGNAGQYAFIPFDRVISGIPMTATVINDNTTTSATFNFTDKYLAQLMSSPDTNVSNFTSKIQVPPAKNITYSRSLRMMVYTAPKGFETGYLISPVDDPESVTGDDSFFKPGTTQDTPMGWVELRGSQYALKSESAHAVTPGAVPNSWAATEAWTGSGPCGVRAYAVSGAAANPVTGDSQFCFYAHEGGLYRWMGGDPYPLTKFLKGQWKRLNRAYKHLVSVDIDEENREVRVCAPLDDSGFCNYVFTINYTHGWGDPMVYSHYKRAWMPNPEGWKWSLDYYPAGIEQSVSVNRSLPSAPDRRLGSSQILMAGTDGAVRMIVPDSYSDDTHGIDYQQQTAFAKGPNLEVLGFGGLKVKARGQGTMYLTPMTEDGPYGPPIPYTIPAEKNGISNRFDIQTRGEGDNFGWLITNGYDPGNPEANAGAWMEITELDIIARLKWRAKRG